MSASGAVQASIRMLELRHAVSSPVRPAAMLARDSSYRLEERLGMQHAQRARREARQQQATMCASGAVQASIRMLELRHAASSPVRPAAMLARDSYRLEERLGMQHAQRARREDRQQQATMCASGAVQASIRLLMLHRALITQVRPVPAARAARQQLVAPAASSTPIGIAPNSAI